MEASAPSTDGQLRAKSLLSVGLPAHPALFHLSLDIASRWPESCLGGKEHGASLRALTGLFPWDDDGSEWTRQPVAQLRYDPQERQWQLYWADRNDRRHSYDMIGPAARVKTLLTEIDTDPTCIFWG